VSLFFGDLRIKAAVELGLEDIKKNPWLLDDILGDTIANPYLRERYGSQISSCKEWLANNRINILLSARDDKVEFPCITIELGTSNEKADMKHLGDLSVERVKLIPNDINKPIPFVVKPVAGSNVFATGIFTFSVPVNLTQVAPGMILVDPSTGTGYVIQSVVSANQVNLGPGYTLSAATYGIIPKYQHYEAIVGHTFMTEPYKIVCNAMDQNTLLWLHSITVYSLLRYRQVLLEKDGYAESLISSSGMYPNADYSDSGQIIWSRDVNLTGQVENRWVMAPHRSIETVSLGTGGGPSGLDDTYTGGLKIISNLDDLSEDLSTVNWSTIMDTAYENE
jgi:hypothetical protein